MIAYTFYESDSRVKQYSEALAERGDEVEVIALRREGQKKQGVLNNVNVFRIQNRAFNESSKFKYLLKIILFLINSTYFVTKRFLQKRYDIIHVHSIPDFEVFSTIFCRFLGAKIILDIHDIVPEFYLSKFGMDKTNFLFKVLLVIEKISIRFSHHVIIANAIWKERLIERAITKERITDLVNYPNLKIFSEKNQNQNEKYTILYPGSLNWHQGLDIAIKAVDLAKQKISNIEFNIYGDGPERLFLENLVSDLNLHNIVYFHDLVTREEIAQIIAESDIGIIPKRAVGFGNEAYSTKIMQFMACNVPVIVSKTRVDSYYFNDSIVSFFESENEHDLADKIVFLHDNAGYGKTQASKAKEFISKNNWNHKKHIYFDIIDSLLPSK